MLHPSVDLDGGALSRQMALLNLVRRTNAQPPFSVLLEDAAKLSAQGIGVQYYAWGQVVPDEQCDFTLAYADPPEGHARHVTSMFPLSGKTLGAHVLQTGQPISAERFGTQEPMVDVVLQREGVVGGIMVPFHLNKRPAGFLGVYSNIARKWHPDELVFIETVAHLLVAFSARLLAEEQLAAERHARTELLETINAIVITLDPEGRIVDINQPGQRLTGYSLKEVCGAPFCSKLVPPSEMELVQGILRSCRSESFTNEYTGWLMRKDGSQLRVAWTLKALHNGQMQSMVLIGIDRTEQLQAMDKLRRMTSIAHNAMGALYSNQEEHPRQVDGGSANRPDGRPRLSPAAVPLAVAGGQVGDLAGRTPLAYDGGVPSLNIKPPQERRAGPRRPFPYRQPIAPMVDGRLPAEADFVEVECQDISSAGVAFFFDRVPAFTELVLLLGSPPQVTKLVCRVARVACVEHNGEKRYLVGCRFIGRCKR
ncbi:MAG: PAS domain S-box protein [Thermoguttaceae bacterium]|jgi:PAS domain S-box-containing protein|nr:PAS domain S-box protein [Thermoguttaceae bacterium]